MIQVSFPDGAVRSYENGVSALDIATSISEGLARKVLVASVNGVVVDANRPITTDAAVIFNLGGRSGKKYFLALYCSFNGRSSRSYFPRS